MLILYLIIEIILLYYILGGIIAVLGSILTTKELIKKKKIFRSSLKNKYCILLPVYHEQDIIQESINYFYSIFKDYEKVKIFIIANERENCKNSTYEMAKKQIEKMNAENIFTLLNAPKEYKNKVGQINYVVKNNFIENDEIVGIYDIDSRPDNNALKIVDDLVTKNNSVNIFQQVSSYCNNLNNLSGINKILSTSDALTQTKWALGFEYQLYLLYSKMIKSKKLRPLVYCVGHGLYVRSSFLKKISGFPEINNNDDLSFGYLSSVLGETILPIPSLDKCNISFDYKETISQYRFWSRGSNLYYGDINYYQEAFKIKLSKKQKMIFLIQGFLRNFLWAWRGTLWVIITIVSIILNNIPLIVFCFIGLLFYTILPQIIVYFELEKLEKKKISNIFLGVAFSPVNFLLRGIGPTLSLFYRLFGNDREINYKATR